MKINKILSLFFIISIIYSCKEKDTKSFTINGEIAGSSNERVILETFTFPNINGEPKTIVIDTARTDADGKFTMKNYVPERSICRLKIFGNDKFYVLLNIYDETMQIKTDKEDMIKTAITGSQATSVLYTFIDNVRRVNTDIMQTQSMIAQYRKSGEDSLAKVYTTNMSNEIEKYFSEIKSFADTTKEISNSIIALESLVFESHFDKIKAVSEKRKNTADSSSIYMKELLAKVSKYELIMSQEAAKSFIGKQAPEIALHNPDGKIFKLSDLKGKYVLIDFWASWCGPCRRENPNVVAAYNSYKDKGFTIYSVSLDNDKDAWVKAIAKDNLIWPYHVSDLQEMNSDIAKLYNINGIPMNFLLDKNGIVIAENLRGPKLEAELAKVM